MEGTGDVGCCVCVLDMGTFRSCPWSTCFPLAGACGCLCVLEEEEELFLLAGRVEGSVFVILLPSMASRAGMGAEALIIRPFSPEAG